MKAGALMIETGRFLRKSFSGILLATMASNCAAQTMSPKIRLELHIAVPDAGELRQVMARFAESEKFAAEDVGSQLPPKDGRKSFYVKLTRGGTMEVLVTDFLEPGRFLVAFYELKPDPKFSETAVKLEAMLRERWPDKVKPYTGE
jgi:hypothetical protein